MARLVRAALEFNARRFLPRLIFAVFGRRLISPLHSFINLEVFEHNYKYNINLQAHTVIRQTETHQSYGQNHVIWQGTE